MSETTNRKPLDGASILDHSGLSPSGRVSKRARRAWLESEAAKLFPPDFWLPAEPTEREKIEAKVKALRRVAAEVRTLAARGMRVKAFLRHAASLEAQADAIESAVARLGGR